VVALAPLPDPVPLVDDDADDGAALDAYSVAVSTAAERLIPSVASLRVTRQVGGWTAGGTGSAVAIEPVGYLVTSAHVVSSQGTRSVVRPAIEITYPRLLREIKLYPRKPEVAKAFEADTTDFKKL